MKLAVVLGTRPEAIKLAPVISETNSRRDMSAVVINTGQHTDLIQPILSYLNIDPDYDLGIMTDNQSLSGSFSKAISGVDRILKHEKPDYVVVQGDTTTTFAGALAAYYNGIKVIHVEAGLRTYDLSAPYPEEGNRQMVSRIADLHFCATQGNKQALLQEHIDVNKIHVVGNTGLDSIKNVLKKVAKQPQENKKKILLTLHRRESFGGGILSVLDAINYFTERADITVTFPMHPNPTLREIAARTLRRNSNLRLIEPLDYFSFVQEMYNSDVILSDSGGVQEESPFIGKPVVVLRETTERTETLGKSSFLVGYNKSDILYRTMSLLTREEKFEPDYVYGDGCSSKRICDIIKTK